MTHKLFFTSRILISGCAFMLLLSCESPEQHADNAFETVKHNKMFTNDSLIAHPQIQTETAKTDNIQKVEIKDEWSKFKNETEKKILANKNKIQEIRDIHGTDVKLFKRISSLEQGNNDLRKKMDEYKEEEKVRLESFKTIMNHEVNNIGIELKDIQLNTIK